MKKSELNQLVELIECLVSREIKKQLPSIINEIKKSGSIVESAPLPTKNNDVSLKASLKEMFESGNPVENTMAPAAPKKQFVKDPMLNQILNETASDLRTRESSMSPVAAFIEQYRNPMVPVQGMMTTSEEFSENVTAMPSNPLPSRPVPIVADSISLPQGSSVIDIAPVISPGLSKIFNRNYSSTLKAMDKAAKALRPM